MKQVIRVAMLAALVTTPVCAYAKDRPQASGLQLQQIQTRDYEYPKGVVFSAVMSVLQDAGYRITGADKDTGLITGVASTESHMTWVPFVGFGRSKLTPVVSAFIEDRGPSITRLRINFVMSKSKSNQFGSDGGEKPILDPETYSSAFEKVEQAIFVRVAMDAPSPTGSAPAAALVPAAPVQAAPVIAQATPTPATAR